jgi:hypothetical protein
MSVKNCFVRGSIVRYIQLPAEDVDTDLLQDAARREVRTLHLLNLFTAHVWVYYMVALPPTLNLISF